MSVLFCLALLSKYPVIQSAQEGKVVLVPLLYFVHQKTNPLRGPYQNSVLSLCRISAAAKEAFFHLQMNGRLFYLGKGIFSRKDRSMPHKYNYANYSIYCCCQNGAFKNNYMKAKLLLICLLQQ